MVVTTGSTPGDVPVVGCPRVEVMATGAVATGGWADADARFMAAALALGRRGLGRTAPNPSVGALVVRDGVIVGRGCTGDGGRPHGERIALDEAGDLACGATLYVTLEPCAHHGRTPPCCEAVVAAGIGRLVYAIDDVNPLVAGRGAAFCREHGLEVVGGIGAAEALRDHLGHALRCTADRPAVTLKLAETADGYVAGGPHDPRLAITGVAASGAVHVMRAMHDAVLVGAGTIRGDDPLLTVRLPGVSARPLRVVLDSGLTTPAHSRLAQTAAQAPILMLSGAEAVARRGAALAALEGVEVAAVSLDAGGRIELPAALRLLAERGLTRIFCEGGPTLASALIHARLADDVLIFTAPRPFAAEGVATLDASARSVLATRYRPCPERFYGSDRLSHWSR